MKPHKYLPDPGTALFWGFQQQISVSSRLPWSSYSNRTMQHLSVAVITFIEFEALWELSKEANKKKKKTEKDGFACS